MNKTIKQFLDEKLGEEAQKVTQLFEKSELCFNGQVDIASAFVYAKEQGVSIDRVLTECQKIYNQEWSLQHPDIRGDTDFGKNYSLLREIYHKCGIAFPQP